MGVIGPALAVLGTLVLGAAATAWLEPRLLGPEAGPAAPARTREGLSPPHRDAWLYDAAPLLAVLGAAWGLVVVPFGPGLVGADLGIGLFYFIVVLDFVLLGVAVGGWGANGPSGVEACYRAVAQLVAYVVPLGLAVIGPIMMARSLSTVAIVRAQVDAGLWYVLVQPLGFVLYLATGLMQVYRAPFLEPFAARLDHGVLGLSGGWRALLWRLALSGALFVVAAMGAVLFLGGWAGPGPLGPLWMGLKTFAVMALMLVLGRRVRLLSTAETIAVAWKILIPVGLLNVLVVGILVLLGVGQSPFEP